MNEVSNFCNIKGMNQVCEYDPTCSGPDGCCVSCTTPDPTNTYDFPPFLPDIFYSALGEKTIPASSVHYGDILDYNAHSLFGFMESIATRQSVIAATAQRPFILSRSTYSGSGVHTAHWTGDNAATWDDLAASIITMNNMALFGIPMIGADICGFIGATTEELCTRWIEVGAFSPFSRDHNEYGAPPQELYRWDSVAEASRIVLGLRYRLLPHLYTLMYNAHSHGRTVHNALWMHFSFDTTTLTETDGQYMWAGGLLFTPVLTEGALSVRGYFPQSLWYSLLDDSMIDASDGGKFVELDTPLLSTNVHARAGQVIPMQDSAMTTAAVKASPYTLLVTLYKDFSGLEGNLFIDDGVQVDLNAYSLIRYLSNVPSTLISTVVHNTYTTTTAVLSTVEIRGVQGVTDTTCSATITTDTGRVIEATTATLIPLSAYNKLVLTFDPNPTSANSINIATNYTLVWDCSEDNNNKSNDDTSGWTALPAYAQGLIITACVVIGVGAVAVGYFVFKASQGRTSEVRSSLL
jgi:alpha-D-xyloside xylohydrolase